MNECPCCAGKDTGDSWDLCDPCLEAWMHEMDHECERTDRPVGPESFADRMARQSIEATEAQKAADRPIRHEEDR